MAAKGLVACGVPVLPASFIYIIGSKLLLSIVVLALAAHAQSLSGHYYYDSDVTVFLLFVSIWTWLVSGSALAIQYCAPQHYYRLFVLISQVLSFIFWLVGWAWAVSWAAYVLSFDNYDSHDKIRGYWKAFGQTVAAAAGVGALICVLCAFTLTLFCSACTRSLPTEPANHIELVNASKPHDAQNQAAFPSQQGYTTQSALEGEPPSLPHNHQPNL
ncbi:hypothetical protein GGR50DRAFT_331464 [Xylaria sp. CBS 124048]|nr:hypothetical protein GGR50DRAFT_331464 [Xylaria sp. CBS 124048]